MKALLLKDFYALQESRVLLGLTLVLSVVMGFLGNAVFIQSYISAISAVLVLNAISYDEVDNGYAFLFTLPVSRKQYVIEKYVFGWVTACAGWGIAIILAGFVDSVTSQIPGQLQWLILGKTLAILYGGALAIMLVMQAVLIPIQLKFGGQKGKIAVLLTIGAAFGMGALSAKLIGNTVDNGINMIWDFLSSCTLLQILGIYLAAILLSTAISFFCSVRIMERKNF